MALFINELESLLTLLDEPFTFIYGSRAEANIRMHYQEKANGPFCVYEISDPLTPTLSQSGRMFSRVEMSFLFFDFDRQGATQEDTAYIQDRMMRAAVKFTRILDEAKVSFRDNSQNIESAPVTLFKHLFDADVSGALVTMTVPVDLNVSFCPPEDWTEFDC